MMTRDDWAALTDADSAAQLELALADRDRRERLATIPTQVSQLAEMFVSGGGEPAKIEEAVLNVTQLQLKTLPSGNEPTQSEMDNLVTEWPKTLPDTNV